MAGVIGLAAAAMFAPAAGPATAQSCIGTPTVPGESTLRAELSFAASRWLTGGGRAHRFGGLSIGADVGASEELEVGHRSAFDDQGALYSALVRGRTLKGALRVTRDLPGGPFCLDAGAAFERTRMREDRFGADDRGPRPHEVAGSLKRLTLHAGLAVGGPTRVARVILLPSATLGYLWQRHWQPWATTPAESFNPHRESLVPVVGAVGLSARFGRWWARMEYGTMHGDYTDPQMAASLGLVFE